MLLCTPRLPRTAVLPVGMAAFGLVWLASPAFAQDVPLKVVVTLKPIHALVLQVMDGTDTPSLVVNGTASPHTYALKPSDAKLFNDADVVFRVSESLEAFTAKVVRSLPKTVQVVTLEQAAGMKTLPRRTGATFEGHNHGGKSHAGHGHGHAPGAKASKTAIDGHLWLDPANAKAAVAVIAETLAAKRPKHADAFKINAAKAIERLKALEADLAVDLKNAAGKPYVVFHDAFQYLEARYGLVPVGSITIDPDIPPSGKRLVDLRKKITTLGASCVFAEPSFENKLVQTVIEGTAAKTGTLDPEGLMVPAGPDAYDVLMRRLSAGLKACLAPSS
jgi:zinc transport system substrate-binding protein